MAVTKSWEQRTIVRIGPWKKAVPAERRHELPWLAGASLMVCAGIVLALLGKTANFREMSAQLDRGELLDLNAVDNPEQVLPFLQVFPDSAERH